VEHADSSRPTGLNDVRREYPSQRRRWTGTMVALVCGSLCLAAMTPVVAQSPDAAPAEPSPPAAVALAAAPPSASGLSITVVDRPNDAGNGLLVRWTAPADAAGITGFEVARSIDGSAWQPLKSVPAAVLDFEDGSCAAGKTYRYRVTTVGGGDPPLTAESADVTPVVQWLDLRRLWFGLFVVLICGAVLVCTQLARLGREFYVRPIPGLQAIPEAVGRATEMGRPVLFVPGVQDLDQTETVAGITVLSYVAKTVAEYDATLNVPTARSLVMTAAQEAVSSAYLTVGRPESYNSEQIYYVTDEQFGYVAYVCGWMARERPAACFYLGKFYAESLVLSEVGNSVGAIQVAGTAEAAQLPFFVAACDYTMLGEELFAASAYLSRDPEQLGTLQGQDLGKFLAAAFLIAGGLLATIAAVSPEGSGPRQAIDYLRNTVLSRESA
jgi:hypothetical protein